MADFFVEGQKALKLLERDIQMNTVRQGYIFEGEEGIGKKTAARRFAQMIFCTNDKKPCNSCHGCKMFLAGSHPDLYVLEDAPVKIDAVRKMNDELFVKPIIAGRKVFIVEHADEMNTAAQNAFLKSFEEPPKYAVIILITKNAQSLLPTILSRGTKVVFSPFSEKEIEKFLWEKYSIDGVRASFISRYSAGLIGRCISLTESEEFFKKRDKMIKAISTMTGDKISILDVLDAFEANSKKSNEDINLYFDIFMGFFRDVAVIKLGGRIVNSDYKELLEEFSGKVRASSARGVVEIAAKVKSQINTSMKYDLWIINMLINCWEEIHGTGNRS